MQIPVHELQVWCLPNESVPPRHEPVCWFVWSHTLAQAK